MHRGEVFHLLWWQNDTKPRDNDNNIFYSHLSLHTQSLQSTWQTPAEWMEVPRAAFGTGQGGTVHQPCQTTRVVAKARALWVISGSVIISDRVPPTAEPRQNQWIATQKPHSADLSRCGTRGKLHSDIPRAIPACCCCTFSALSLCLFGIWKV